MDHGSMQHLIDYMYTGELLITESNVEQLLVTANLLGITNIKDSCAQFIQSQLDVDNCLSIRHFADIHACHVLQKHSDAFIDQHFRCAFLVCFCCLFVLGKLKASSIGNYKILIFLFGCFLLGL